MKNLTCFLIFSVVIGYASAQQSKSLSATVAKTDLLSYADIKPIVLSANKDRDYTDFYVQGFKLTMTLAENTPQGTLTTTYTEPADGGKLTEKQRALIEQYAPKGASFRLEEITMINNGKPGTPYDPGKTVTIGIPTIFLSIQQ